jgi:thiol-disulfide isomerase/thioredoxin
MKRLLLCICAVLCANLVHSQSEPVVVVDNIAVAHETGGWRVVNVSTAPVHFNLLKGDLIVRIDGKNAAETGPMIIASLFNQGYRRQIHLFIERGDLRLETGLKDILSEDYEPVGANPFWHVASGFYAPATEFKDIDGRPLTLEKFEGKWLLIDFVATWCAPCIDTLPKVLSVAEHHDLSLNLLTIALNDKAEAVRRMQQRYGINSPTAMMQATAQLPIDFGVTTNRWTGQVPSLVLLRPDGEVAMIEVGGFDASYFEKTIECETSCKADEVLK